MIKTFTVTRSDSIIPSYGLGGVGLSLEMKVTAALGFVERLFLKSLIGQIFLLITSDPDKTSSKTIMGGENR